jgi:hypothetical protein
MIQHFLVIQDHIQKQREVQEGERNQIEKGDAELTSFSSFVHRCTGFFITTNAKHQSRGEILIIRLTDASSSFTTFQQENEQHTHELIAKSLRMHINQIIVPTTNHVFYFKMCTKIFSRFHNNYHWNLGSYA